MCAMEKILVVDDEKATLSMLSLLLEAYGYTVLTAENGESGLEIFRNERPSIVLTDIKMPGMDGIEMLQKGSRGTGLGLMITKKIINEHGGIIGTESEKDRGTKFFIRLPERDHSLKS